MSFKVFAYRSQLFSPMLVSSFIYREIPPDDPDPPERSWFSMFVLAPPFVPTQRFFRGL
jgi:hypothetical protein